MHHVEGERAYRDDVHTDTGVLGIDTTDEELLAIEISKAWAQRCGRGSGIAKKERDTVPLPFFGGKVLTEIRPSDVEAFRAQRKKKNGTKPSIQTVNNDHVVLKHCLNVAIRRGLLQINPATRVPLPDPQNARDRVLTEEEWTKLYEAAKGHLKPVLLLAYQLGQRFGEIVGLTWDRVDLKRGFITLRSQDTKTKKPRQVPMTPDIRMALQRLAKVRSLSTRHVFYIPRQTYPTHQPIFSHHLEGCRNYWLLVP
jgi:integrase